MKPAASSPGRRKAGADRRHEKDADIQRQSLRRMEEALEQEQAKRIWRHLGICLENAVYKANFYPHSSSVRNESRKQGAMLISPGAGTTKGQAGEDEGVSKSGVDDPHARQNL